MQSITPGNARYTPGNGSEIGIQNNIHFTIYVVVLSNDSIASSLEVRSMAPGTRSSWIVQSPEVVLISMGSTPGLPRAYLGRPGFILHIDDWI